MHGAVVSGSMAVDVVDALRNPDVIVFATPDVKRINRQLENYQTKDHKESRRLWEWLFFILIPELKRPTLSLGIHCVKDIDHQQKVHGRWDPNKHVRECLACRIRAWNLWNGK